MVSYSSSSRASCAAEIRACGFLSRHAFCMTGGTHTHTHTHTRTHARTHTHTHVKSGTTLFQHESQLYVVNVRAFVQDSLRLLFYKPVLLKPVHYLGSVCSNCPHCAMSTITTHCLLCRVKRSFLASSTIHDHI